MSWSLEMMRSVAGFANAAMPSLSAIMTGLTAGGQIAMGGEARGAAEAEAAQLRQRATMTRAIGSRQAERIRQASDRIRARQRTLMAASGFSASDVTSREIDSATERESSINEMLAVAQAEDEARQDEMRARLREQQGRSEQRASWMAAGRTLIEGVVSWRDRFGKTPRTAAAGAPAGGTIFDEWNIDYGVGDDPAHPWRPGGRDPYHRQP